MRNTKDRQEIVKYDCVIATILYHQLYWTWSNTTTVKKKGFYDAFDVYILKMKEGEGKWRLRSERVVEDILYSYGGDLL